MDTKFIILRKTSAISAPLGGRALVTPDGPDGPAEGEPLDLVEESLGDVWVPMGEQLARDRDAALRLFLGEPVREIDDTFCAVSDAAWKPRHVTIKPSIKITEA